MIYSSLVVTNIIHSLDLNTNQLCCITSVMPVCLLKMFLLINTVVDSQLYPPPVHFMHGSAVLPNNSYIYYASISVGEGSLKCVTDSVNCCSDSDVGNWRDERGRADEATCLYVTRGQGEVSLNRNNNSDCIPETSGLWRCDIPDFDEELQTIYIYISNDTAYSKQL